MKLARALPAGVGAVDATRRAAAVYRRVRSHREVLYCLHSTKGVRDAIQSISAVRPARS